MTGKKNIKPGEFVEITGRKAKIKNSEKPSTPKQEPQIYYSDDLIAIYTAFRDQVYNPKSVLYPSCGFDASPARVFDDVTFVDVEKGNEGCIGKLQEAGLNALKQDIRAYRPKDLHDLHDLLILLNPNIPTEWASIHLRSGGYILSNNYHGNASEMYDLRNQFSLWGVIDFAIKDRRKGDNRVVVSRDLEGLFQPVANEEELRRFRPEYYEFLKGVVRSFAMTTPGFDLNRPFEELWVNYRELMHEGMPSKRAAERYIFVKK